MTTPGSAAAQPGPAPPRCFATCYGPEFVAQAVQTWLASCSVETLYIEPGKPWQNGKEERFNGTVRDACLNL